MVRKGPGLYMNTGGRGRHTFDTTESITFVSDGRAGEARGAWVSWFTPASRLPVGP